VAGHDVTRFVAPDDPEAFAAALRGLLDDPQSAKALGARARSYADIELGWDRIARTTKSVYETILARHR